MLLYEKNVLDNVNHRGYDWQSVEYETFPLLVDAWQVQCFRYSSTEF